MKSSKTAKFIVLEIFLLYGILLISPPKIIFNDKLLQRPLYFTHTLLYVCMYIHYILSVHVNLLLLGWKLSNSHTAKLQKLILEISTAVFATIIS